MVSNYIVSYHRVRTSWKYIIDLSVLRVFVKDEIILSPNFQSHPNVQIENVHFSILCHFKTLSFLIFRTAVVKNGCSNAIISVVFPSGGNVTRWMIAETGPMNLVVKLIRPTRRLWLQHRDRLVLFALRTTSSASMDGAYLLRGYVTVPTIVPVAKMKTTAMHWPIVRVVSSNVKWMVTAFR